MFGNSDYECSAPLEGDAEAALELAKVALLGQGFVILKESLTGVQVKGPGMRSTGQAPLVGVSELQLDVEDRQLRAYAALRGTRKLQLFALFFPCVLSLLLAQVLYSSGMSPLEALLWGGVPILGAPLMMLWLEQRTKNAVFSLLMTVSRAKRSSVF